VVFLSYNRWEHFVYLDQVLLVCFIVLGLELAFSLELHLPMELALVLGLNFHPFFVPLVLP
jgi:hypothetical protein